MKAKTIAVVFLITTGALFGCKQKELHEEQLRLHSNTLLNKLNERLTEATIAGSLSPPAVARCFAYANVGAFEAVVIKHNGRSGFSGKLNGYVRPNLEVDTIISLAT